MRLEPDIDQLLLLAALREEYGIHATRLTFVPVGFVTISYIVECPGQSLDRYFLKLWNDSRVGSLSASRIDTYHPLVDQLRAQGLRVPRALPGLSGELKTRASEFTLVLYEYLPYPTLEALNPQPPDLPYRLGRLIARLHRATASVDTRALARESFDVPFASTLLACLAELETGPALPRPGQRALRELLLPHKAHLLVMLERLRALGRQARKLAPPFVVVHTDLNSTNVMAAPDGELLALDWEGAMLAPAEHDLFIYTGDDFPALLRAYWQAGGVRDLHAGTFGFYFYRRNLEDLTDWLVTILHENTRDEQDLIDLHGIQQDCIDGWQWLEKGIERVAEQLQLA